MDPRTESSLYLRSKATRTTSRTSLIVSQHCVVINEAERYKNPDITLQYLAGRKDY